MSTETLNILRVDASANPAVSNTKALGDLYLETLAANGRSIDLNTRDLNEGMPFLNAAWIGANVTPAEDRTDAHKAALAFSDSLVEELKAADVLMLTVPIYNFSIPAVLKAWVDMVARARLTFRYTENGPEGLLKGKKAVIFMASSGTKQDGPVDFAIPYLRHILGFMGITDVTVISADMLAFNADESVARARKEAVQAAETLIKTAKAA